MRARVTALALWLAASAAASAPRAEAPSAEQVWRDLAEGNRRFAQGAPRARALVARRRALVTGQKPSAMILSCSDSRTPPELLFDQGLGDLFVVRSAGEVADPVALGSLEYAAEHLGASVLVVMGHRRCGAVAAALEGHPLPTPNLEAIVRRIRPALPPAVPGEDRARRAEDANVREVVQTVLLESPLLREKVASGALTVISTVYDLSTGRVERLP